MVVVDKERVDMKIPESTDSRVVKDLTGYRVNDENFVGVGEITVTITLKEYRSLVGIAATVDEIKSAANDRAMKAERENDNLKKENAKLKQENYDLQKYAEQLKELCAQPSMDSCCKCADEYEEE
jgi:FtsZ-binding cell division protein ZapB